MEREYVVGDINVELEEIERMGEKMQETSDVYRLTYGGAFLSIMCCM